MTEPRADLANRIGQIAVVCKDVARATAFYRDMLGLPFLFAAGPALVVLRLRRRPPHALERQATGHDHLSSMLYYFVDGHRGHASELEAKGVHVRRTSRT